MGAVQSTGDGAIHEQALAFNAAQCELRARPVAQADIPLAAKICERAFRAGNTSVGLGPEFGTECPEAVTAGILARGLTDGFEAFVVENGAGELVGSNCVELLDEVAAIGPLSVDPSSQGAGAGRLLMQAVMRAAAGRGTRTVRLHTPASNVKSFSLYLGLGFDPLHTLAGYEGVCTAAMPRGFRVRPLAHELVEACDALHYRLCGLHRRNGIAAAVTAALNPMLVVLDGKDAVVAYSTGFCLAGHTVAATEDALHCLVVAQSKAVEEARAAGQPLPLAGLLVPHTYPGVARWLVRNGFRLERQWVEMGYGSYIPPKKYYFPAVSY